MKNIFRVLPIAALVVFLPSCSARINAQLLQNGSGTAQLQAQLEPNMVALIRSFASMGGNSSTGTVLDAAAINRSLLAANGIASAALRNSGQERVEGSIGINQVKDFLNSGAYRFVQYEANGTSGRLAILINRTSAPQILKQIYPEAVDYLSALMAPAATGEALSKADYLTLVESVYGKPMANEIAAARVTAVIAMPGAVKAVKGGGFSGKEARFDISLVDLLVLERPLEYEITW